MNKNSTELLQYTPRSLPALRTLQYMGYCVGVGVGCRWYYLGVVHTSLPAQFHSSLLGTHTHAGHSLSRQQIQKWTGRRESSPLQ